MTRIIIFAKAPHAGLAKTRLIPALGAAGAAQLAARMLLRTMQAALDAGLGPVELCVTPGMTDPAWAGISIPPAIVITTQCEGDLGARMATATRLALAHDTAVLLIGTDCVEMHPDLLRQAASALQHADATLHPAADGGYALLGLRRYHAALFSDMTWSTDSVAATTVRRIAALRWVLHTGATLHDIDLPQDLHRLPTDLLAPRCSD